MLYKFRVWNRFDKVMIDEPHSMRLVAGEMKSSEDDILMQFTGLTDKNGVEIFEGDRIKYPGCKSISTVVFEGGCFIADNDFIKRDPELLRRAAGTKETEGHAVVIGNIHQHGHLLEGKND